MPPPLGGIHPVAVSGSRKTKMAEPREIKHRVADRGPLIRRLGGLVIAVHRFGRCRARTEDERRWAARVIDALQAALDAAGVQSDWR